MSQKTYMYDIQWQALINAINGGDTSAIATALGQIKTSVDDVATAIGNQSIRVDLSDITSSAVLNLSNVSGDTLTDVINSIDYDLNFANRNEYIDITADFDNAIFSSNLSKYHTGNYIKKTYNNVTYVAVLSDYNTFYNPDRNDYANINVPHWTAIVFGFPSGQMNTTGTTANGFTGSVMNEWLKGDCTTIVKGAFGESHLKSHQCLLSTGTYNSSLVSHGFSWAWESNHYTMIMTEAQLGYRAWSDLGWSIGEAHKPLKIFQNDSPINVLGRNYGQSNNNFNTSGMWLRDISAFSPDSYFCNLYSYGIANRDSATAFLARLPIIILV